MVYYIHTYKEGTALSKESKIAKKEAKAAKKAAKVEKKQAGQYAKLVKSIRNGNISRRPASISKQNTSLANGEKFAKLPVGPTSDIPGPILLSVAITELNVVAKSLLSKAIINTEPTMIAAYAIR